MTWVTRCASSRSSSIWGYDHDGLPRVDIPAPRGVKSKRAARISDRPAIRPRPGEEGLSHLDVARHSDIAVTLQRLTKKRLRFAAITWGGAIDEHHCVEATYLGLLEEVGKGLGLLHRDLKMVFSGSPLTCRCCGETRDRLRAAGDRPKRFRSSVGQLASKRVKLRRLRLLAEHDESLNHQREHQP